MPFALGRLKAVEGTRSWPDPWNLGWSFSVHRYDSRHHQEFLKRQQREDPLIMATLDAVVRKQLAAQAAGKLRKSNEGETEAEPLDWNQIGAEAALAKIEAGELTTTQVIERLDSWKKQIAEAANLIAAWSGLCGEDGTAVLCCDDAKLELLTDERVVPEGESYAGRFIGEALVEYVIAKSKWGTEQAAAVLELAEGNSVASAGGDTSSGPN